MHSKVAGAIQEIDAALFNGDTFDGPDDCAELAGSWRDDGGVVHVVNATWIETGGNGPAIDLGRETACGSVAWDPDHPSDYPSTTNETVDCMTCVVRRARSCP